MEPKKQSSRNRIKQQLEQLREITAPKTGASSRSGALDDPMERAEKDYPVKKNSVKKLLVKKLRGKKLLE